VAQYGAAGEAAITPFCILKETAAISFIGTALASARASFDLSVLNTCVTKQTKGMHYSGTLLVLSFGRTHDDAACPGE
jgi:hypothetical protein